jgi:excisionase family DNA binding protein
MRASKRKDRVPIADKIALTTDEACALAGMGLNKLYDAMRDGHLIARKSGTRTIILRSDLDKFLQQLPVASQLTDKP